MTAPKIVKAARATEPTAEDVIHDLLEAIRRLQAGEATVKETREVTARAKAVIEPYEAALRAARLVKRVSGS